MVTVNEVINAFAVVNEDGEATSFDFVSFDKLVTELISKRKEIREANKETIKEQKKADNEVLAQKGKEYYNSLKENDEFDYLTSDGVKVHAKKITTKSGSNATAACEVISGIEIKSSAKRYPKFHQVIVPEDFSTDVE